jgi:hypothetical protein
VAYVLTPIENEADNWKQSADIQPCVWIAVIELALICVNLRRDLGRELKTHHLMFAYRVEQSTFAAELYIRRRYQLILHKRQ